MTDATLYMEEMNINIDEFSCTVLQRKRKIHMINKIEIRK